MAAEIVGEFQAEPEMIKGKGGTFVVTLDGQTLWDKKQSGRFPDPGEITKIVRERRGGGKKAPVS